MKELTNEVYRTKRKLKLLKEEGMGQLLVDLLSHYDSGKQHIKVYQEDAALISDEMEKIYLKFLEQYKPSEQKELF